MSNEYAIILDERTSFEDAVRALDAGGIGYLAILDQDRQLMGILTDGDIRRAILNRKTDLLDIMNSQPQTADCTLSRRQIVQRLKEMHRKHMPLIDADNRYQGVVALDDLEFNAKPNRVVIMAGGMGTRLGELTKHTPKPMLEVGKKSILENLIEIFCDYGFNRFYISVNYKAEIIKEYFGDGSEFGADIKYLEEKMRLGTAGCLSLIEEDLSEPFFVINGDVLTAVNFEEVLGFHLQCKADATMCVREFEMEVPYGVVNHKNNRIVSLAEKPVHRFHVNSGVYLLDPMVLQFVPRETFFNMTDLFDNLIERQMNVASFELKDYWIDVGRPTDFEKAKKDFLV
ncbi:MAG: nucleotidyl transferase [Desulfuromonas sp.]|nr:MAG: nucleotidyl transferase [Desulfuromonas sp.]